MKTHNTLHLIKRTGAVIAAVIVLAAVIPSPAGILLKLYYEPITGNAVSDLTSAPVFPASPSFHEVLISGLQEGVNWGENFGAWTRGFIEAPHTGQYTATRAPVLPAEETWIRASVPTNPRTDVRGMFVKGMKTKPFQINTTAWGGAE